MTETSAIPPGRFCWLDLAASDLAAAAGFYAGVFGWTAQEEHAAGGRLLRFRHAGREVASAYQLRPRHLAAGVPSHWTPYLRVAALEPAIGRVGAAAGRVVVPPFGVSDRVRVALVQDPAGALLGLWEEGSADAAA